jgi:hypothetical protein
MAVWLAHELLMLDASIIRLRERSSFPGLSRDTVTSR